jgi:hypothetical protein
MPITRLEAGKHTCFGQLTAPETSLDGDVPSFLDRPAMLVYAGKFQSMDGEVEVTEEQIDKLVSLRSSYLSRIKRLATGDIPVHQGSPLQLDHSVSAAATVGRVLGSFSKGLHTLESGETVPALYCDKVRVLGRENVEKVRDGRWSSVSIGADLDSGLFNELSIVPFPAAANAALLSKGTPMKLGALIQKLFRLASEQEGEAKADKLKKRLMDKEKLSAEDAEKKLSEMDDEAKTKLAGEMDAEELAASEAEKARLASEQAETARLAAEKDAETARLAKEKTDKEAADAASAATRLAAKTSFITLAKGMKAKSQGVQLAARKAQLGARLSGLRASAKITPAEIKKIDLDKLAAETDATVDAVFKTYESREPVILAGILGSAKATNLVELSKDLQAKKLEAETVSNMPFLKNARLSKDKKGAKLAEGTEVVVQPGAQAHVDTTPHTHIDLAMGEIEKMLDNGDHNGAKTALRALSEKLKGGGMAAPGPESAPVGEVSMSALAADIKTLHNQFEELVRLVGPNLGVEAAELE